MIKGRLIGILAVVLVIGVLLILSYEKGSVTINPAYQTSSMKQLHLTHRENNEVKWELSAENAIFPTGEKKIFLHSLGLRISNSPEIFLTGGKGVYEIERGDIILDERVTLNVKDTVFSTNSLKWDSSRELITTDDAVLCSGKNFTIEGNGLAAKVKQKEVTILSDVKALYYH